MSVVAVVSPHGAKATVPAGLVDRLVAGGWKRAAKPKPKTTKKPVEPVEQGA